MLLDANMTIGERFKHIRLQKGFSQDTLKEGICSKTVISHLENDRNYPSASMMGKLADKLGVPLREIMGMQEQQLEVSFQIEIVRVYIERADYSRALNLIDELDRREDLLDHQCIDLMIYKANCLLHLRRYEQVIDLLRPFLDQQQILQTVSDIVLCDTFNKLGNALYRLNDFDKAYSAFEQGYNISLGFEEFDLVAARVTKNLGLTCNQLGYKEDSRRYLQNAYVFFERMADMKELANTLFTMSLATGKDEYMIKARSIYESLNLVREANIAKQNYAFYVLSQRDYQLSLEEFDSAVEGFESIEEQGLCSYTLARSAIVSINKGEFQEAERRIKDAESYRAFMSKDDDYLSIDFFVAKAMLNLEQGNYDECIKYSQKSSEMCAKLRLDMEGASCLELSAKAYYKKGQHEEAYLISTKALEMMRSRRKK